VIEEAVREPRGSWSTRGGKANPLGCQDGPQRKFVGGFWESVDVVD
jgi:hypothetical protein